MLSEGFKSKKDHCFCFYCFSFISFLSFFLIRSFLLKIISVISNIRPVVKGLLKVIKKSQNRHLKVSGNSFPFYFKILQRAFDLENILFREKGIYEQS